VGLSKGRNAKAIWQDLVDTYGFTGAYQSVKRFIRNSAGSSRRKPLRSFRPAPGEEIQVDYGTAPWSAMRTGANTGARGYSC